MLAAFLVAVHLGQAQPLSIQLRQGDIVSAPDGSFRYWGTSDTSLDVQEADQNFGGDGVLEGGPGRTILIRFGDLDRALGGRAKILDATLFLTPSGADKPELGSVARLKAPWGEGPCNTISALTLLTPSNQPPAAKNAPPPTKPAAPVWSATWKSRRAGENGIAWQAQGASGPSDAEKVDGAAMQVGDREIAISGLTGAVQHMADRWYENDGLELNFANNVEFYSSKAPINRPRLVITFQLAAPTKGPDLSVTLIERGAQGPGGSGSDVTYTAHVKNVGDAPAAAFQALWVTGERDGAKFPVDSLLAPGQEVTLVTHQPFKFNPADHRLQPIGLRIFPGGADAGARNDFLQIQQSGLGITVNFDRSKLGAVLSEGALEDWAQYQVRLFDDIYADQSRFSFAPEGARERLVISGFGTGTSSGAAHNVDWSTLPKSATSADPAFIAALGKAAGLPGFSGSSIAAGANSLAPRGCADPYAGVMGYGDTRNESLLPKANSLPFEPAYSPVTSLRPLEPTSLLCQTDVAALELGLSQPSGGTGLLSRLPHTMLIRAIDLQGRPLASTSLTFFQLSEGKFSGDMPAFSVTTDASGNAILPRREDVGPFGKLDPSGGNGVLLIKATSNGTTAWGWLKAWQLIDLYDRGNTGAAIVDIRLDLPSAQLEPGTNLAADKLISDSSNSLPAKLAPLIDGDDTTEAMLGGRPGDWVEIDLGRDRTIGEIDLVGKADTMWQQFDILVYSTGQQPGDAIAWAKEVDWNWTATNRGDPSKGGASVSYRGQSQKIRYVRILNRTSASGKLAEIRVVPAVVSP